MSDRSQLTTIAVLLGSLMVPGWKYGSSQMFTLGRAHGYADKGIAACLLPLSWIGKVNFLQAALLGNLIALNGY